MAEMSDNERRRLTNALMRSFSSSFEEVVIESADLRAAVDALDTWIDDNGAQLNAALPQPARSSLTTAQKSIILTGVTAARYVIDTPDAIATLVHLVGQISQYTPPEA